MRKLKMQIQMSLDGYVAGPNGELDWMWIGKQDPEVLQRVIDIAATCDTILLGRKMTPGFVTYWEDVLDHQPESIEQPLARLMVDLHKIVFSRSGTKIDGRNLEVESRDLATVVSDLKKRPGKDIIVYGGAEFVKSLINLGLVDEFLIFRRPVAIGKGLTIFDTQKVFSLDNSTTYSNGTTLHRYLPVAY